MNNLSAADRLSPLSVVLANIMHNAALSLLH